MTLMTVAASAQAKRLNYHMDTLTKMMTSIRVKDDPTRMNWIIPADGTKYPWICDPKYQWGTFNNSIPRGNETIIVNTDLQRYVMGYNIVEVFTIENKSTVPVDLSQISICTPWNAHYLDIDTATSIRCNVKVFLKNEGNGATCVKGTRLNGKGPHVGLMVVKGDISSYSVGDCNDLSDNSTCGVMYMNLEKVMLQPKKKYVLEWHIFAYNDTKDFLKRIKIKFGGKTELKGLE